jgi:hypothetical protein
MNKIQKKYTHIICIMMVITKKWLIHERAKDEHSNTSNDKHKLRWNTTTRRKKITNLWHI